MRANRLLIGLVVLALVIPIVSRAQSVGSIESAMIALFRQIVDVQNQLIQTLDEQVAELKTQLSSAIAQLATSQSDAASVRSELAMTKGVLSSANDRVSDLQKQLSTANSNLASAQSDLATTKTQLESTQHELAACRTPPQKNTSCVWNGTTYPEGTIMPFGLLPGYQLNSPVPAAAMQMVSQSQYLSSNACATDCNGYVYRYKCQNGDWVKVDTGYPYPGPIALKPVIYLYPTVPIDATVKLSYEGELSSSYPPYDAAIGGWKVTAYPSGTLINLADGREYSYLFWEGKDYRFNIDETKGFVVKGSDTREFLQTKLAELGLIPREYNEFIVYWLPKMEHNTYNFVQFVGKEYTESAPLSIEPKPDSMLRVFMAFKPLDSYRQVTPQVIQSFKRKGFTVVEWGGTEL